MGLPVDYDEIINWKKLYNAFIWLQVANLPPDGWCSNIHSRLFCTVPVDFDIIFYHFMIRQMMYRRRVQQCERSQALVVLVPIFIPNV